MVKKIYASLIALIMIGFTLTTSVYAWFSVSRTGMIEGLEMGVGLDDDLMLSLDGATYHKELTNDMIIPYIGENPNLSSITSSNGYEFYKGPISSAKAQVKSDYISFTIYFKVVSDNPNVDAHHKYVYLANKRSPTYQDSNVKGTYITSQGKNWISPITFDNGSKIVNSGESGMYYSKDAIRISAVDSSNQLRFIYDPSNNPERGFGRTFGAYDYYQKRLGISLDIPDDLPDVTNVLTQFSLLQDDIALEKVSLVEDLILVSNQAGVYEYRGFATINIWLEGWDADCFDSILADSLKIKLSFKSARYNEVID